MTLEVFQVQKLYVFCDFLSLSILIMSCVSDLFLIRLSCGSVYPDLIPNSNDKNSLGMRTLRVAIMFRPQRP